MGGAVSRQLSLLIQLQALDHEGRRLRGEAADLPRRLAQGLAPLEAAEAAWTQARHEAERLAKLRREREQALASAEAHLTKLKARVGEIKTNKEYQAHLAEVEAAQRAKGHDEEAALEVMVALDVVQREVASLAAQVTVEQGTADELRRWASEEALKIAGTIEGVGEKRATLAAQVDPSLADQYEQILRTKGDLAIVPMADGACTGCHLHVPPQLAVEVKAEEQVLHCSYCLRILYAPGRPVSPSPLPTSGVAS